MKKVISIILCCLLTGCGIKASNLDRAITSMSTSLVNLGVAAATGRRTITSQDMGDILGGYGGSIINEGLWGSYEERRRENEILKRQEEYQRYYRDSNPYYYENKTGYYNEPN